MIICDRCKTQVHSGARVPIYTKGDVYGEDSDYCKPCADTLTAELKKVKDYHRAMLQRDTERVMRGWKMFYPREIDTLLKHQNRIKPRGNHEEGGTCG